MIGIFARINRHGVRHVTIVPTNDAQRFLDNTRFLATSHRAQDWQSAVCDDVKDAASSLMADFGIAWFNVARDQLAQLGWKPC